MMLSPFGTFRVIICCSFFQGISAELKSYIAQFKQQKFALMKNKKKTVKCDVCMKVMETIYDDLSDNYVSIFG